MNFRAQWQFLALVSVVALAVPSFADKLTVREARVTNESKAGKTWTRLSGVVEATTDLPLAPLLAVITDWASYPRLFPKIQKADAVLGPGAVFLTETTVVSVLGFEVTNRFTLRVITPPAKTSGAVSVSWVQDSTDGTIDGLEGSWDLEPASDGRSGTLVRYRTVSAVPEGFLGQAGLVGLFFPGELKQIVASVFAEARQRKEKP